MDKKAPKEIKELVQRIKATNNQTKNKIDVLQSILIEYDNFCSQLGDFRGYSVKGLIDDITKAKTKRKNVSKHSLHQEFLRIKEDALFKIEHSIWWNPN